MTSDPSAYRDMHLLDELSRSPETTQRELSQRIGVALGLINLMLRRLAKKGYIKVRGTKRSRIRYLITPQGILEKSRLTYQFIEYSLELYSRVRRSLREQFTLLGRTGHRRILVVGTGELAEIAFLTIQEMGLQCAGVAEEAPAIERFLGQPVRKIADVSPEEYDRVIVASTGLIDEALHRLVTLGVPPDRILTPSGSVPHELQELEPVAHAETAPVE